MNSFQGLPKDVMRQIILTFINHRPTVLTVRRVSWWFYEFISFECNRYWFKEYFTWKCMRDREFAWKNGFLLHSYTVEWVCCDKELHLCNLQTCFQFELPVFFCKPSNVLSLDLMPEGKDMASALGIPSDSPAEITFLQMYMQYRVMPDEITLRNCLFRNPSHWTRVTKRSIWPFYDESVNYLRKIQISGVQLFMGCNTLALREELSKMEIIEIERQKEEMIVKYEKLKIDRQPRIAYQKAFEFCQHMGIDDEEMQNN